MTTVNAFDFDELRLNAAKMFAQSMIFVDDQAIQGQKSDSVGSLARPKGGVTALNPSSGTRDGQDETRNTNVYTFDAKSLIDGAMDLGLICSVLRPEKGDNFKDRVVTAARVSDIVCLDWEIYDDSGEAASKIIGGILQEDNQQNGRLRLIAIYTGDVTNRDTIIGTIRAEIPENIWETQGFREKSFEIESKRGVRIVCLFKKHGVRLDSSVNGNQVSEAELPQRLQSEFSKLSEGLLSNAALATIASIRNSTHHVLSKFAGQMDGPFFHHRALIDNPEDAEEYAVNIILSELKGAVDKQGIGKDHTGPQAIAARIQELAAGFGDAGTLKFHYGGSANPKTHDLDVDHVIQIASDGLDNDSLSILKSTMKEPPGNKVFKKSFSSLFADNLQNTSSQMNQFAALTGVQTYPGSYLCQLDTWFPKLGLGTIVQKCNDESYLLCLQASCDSVRIKDVGNFLFVRLEKKDENPDHVVPIPRDNAEGFDYIGLKIASESYRATCTIKFSACQNTQTVNAKKSEDKPGFFFKDRKSKKYLWVADLKRRRALRIAQNLGQQMGRLGFDEFEPYRN